MKRCATETCDWCNGPKIVSLWANNGTHQKPKSQPTKKLTIGDFYLPPQVLSRFGNDGGLNEAHEEESFKQLQICCIFHSVTGIQRLQHSGCIHSDV